MNIKSILFWSAIVFLAITVLGIGLGFVRSEWEKPALYLYPEYDTVIEVRIDVDGSITSSIPEYGDGWIVHATHEGIIEGKYDYLFYEADLNKNSLPKEGWVISSESLADWLNVKLEELGLNEKERLQFLEYWLLRLPKSKYYEIKLYDEQFLEKNAKLNISPRPDTIIRVNLHFRPMDDYTLIDEPIAKPTPAREGFTVVEWGGVVSD